MKMFLTRLGPNSKLIINGDQSQIDLPRNQTSGLNNSVEILKNVKGLSIIKLNVKDVVRHQIVKDIVDAYDKANSKNDGSKSN